jgi:hypothetical protein
MTVGKKLMICIAGMLAIIMSLSAAAWYASDSLGTEVAATSAGC